MTQQKWLVMFLGAAFLLPFLHFLNMFSTSKPNTSVSSSDSVSVIRIVGNPPTYKLGNILGMGYVSTVYEGENIFSGKDVVIKLTEINETELHNHQPGSNLNRFPASVAKLRRLDMEYEMYRRLNSSRLLKAYWYGRYANYQALVVERVGLSLEEHQRRNRVWTLEDIYQIGVNVILDLQQIHEMSFTHNDIHMGNIAFCTPHQSVCQVNLIDFNNCYQYRSETIPFTHSPPKRIPFRVPVHRFSPPCTYRRMQCSRRDDLIALGYVLVMLSSNHANCPDIHHLRCHPNTPAGPEWTHYSPPLPWISIRDKHLHSYMKSIQYNILNTPGNFTSELPVPYRRYFQHMASLQYDSRPDYEYLIYTLSAIRNTTFTD